MNSEEIHNRQNVPKSGASRTSISVKLPTAETEEGRKSAGSGHFEHIHNPAAVDRLKYTNNYGRPDQRSRRPLSTPNSSMLFSDPPSAAGSGQRAELNYHGEKALIEQAAASIIERAWISYRDCQMFRLLKHAICAAENSLSSEILRKVTPKEAELLNDKSLQIRVRFRFGGSEFPPMIFFKIYIHTNGRGVKYLSGKKLIKPATEAAVDSLRQMGNRLFYDQMLQDNIQQQQYRVTDEVDVTTLKDYMQYLANLDETPAYMGGKENYWRKLTLDVLPRHIIFYDIVEYLYSHRLTERLKAEIPHLMKRPVNQAIQRQHIRIVSQFRAPPIEHAYPPIRSGVHSAQYTGTERRSRQAKIRALKMRKAYGLAGHSREGEAEGLGREVTDAELRAYREGNDNMNRYASPLEDGEEEGEEWETEADKLYEWTQELSFEDLTATPRLVT